MREQLDQPQFGVGRTELLDYKDNSKSKSVVDAYKVFLAETVKLLGGKEATQMEVDEVIEFESRLANVSNNCRFSCISRNDVIRGNN
jgi:hypothetical protein